MEPVKYRTISGQATASYRDRGSEFLAFAYPVKTVEEAKGILKGLKKEHPKAVHHCVAWRIGQQGNEFRASDDGEPSGSAGRPMLGAIDAAGLTNVMVVVVRYFGGTLLGVPGLIKAYRTATEDAVRSAPIEERWVETVYRIELNYPVMGEVLHVLKGAGATIYAQQQELFCTLTVGIPLHMVEDIIGRLSELCTVVQHQ